MIKIKNINFSYGKKIVFKNFSLNLEKGKFYIFMGDNGGGKSTLTKLLLGIEKVDSGDIFIDNKNINENIFEIRKKIGMVFQNPNEQIISDIVEEEVAFSMENYGISSVLMNNKIDEVLKLVNLSGKRDTKISNLSGGEKQKLCIASSLVLSPKLLIVDEGTAMLDIKNRNKILNLLKKLQKDDVTIILITHHLNELDFCDEVIFMDNGEIIFKGNSKKFISSIIKGKFGDNLDLTSSFKIAKFIYEMKKIDISMDIFDLKKVGEHLWNCI